MAGGLFYDHTKFESFLIINKHHMYSFLSKYFDSINNHVIKNYISHNKHSICGHRRYF